MLKAYSGERAAALAYRGHARAVADPGERERIGRIEREEWRHRRRVGRMLLTLGVRPGRRREWTALAVGSVLGALCRWAGRFLPMYAAGLLERGNVGEYVAAAELARRSGRADWIAPLLEMARTEADHERYFRSRVMGDPVLRLLPLWEPPPRLD